MNNSTNSIQKQSVKSNNYNDGVSLAEDFWNSDAGKEMEAELKSSSPVKSMVIPKIQPVSKPSAEGKQTVKGMRQQVIGEVYKDNITALKTGAPPLELSAGNVKYFELGKFIPQKLGLEVIEILTVKKGQNEALFYLDNGIYKPALSAIKGFITQRLGDRYSQYYERDTLAYIQSYLPEEKIQTSGMAKLTPLSTVKAEEVSWLMRPYIPIGKITMLEGDPGLGKTFVALKEAATISTGGFFVAEDGTMSQKVDMGKVLYLTAEDGLGDTLRPRLEKMGANLDNIIALEGKITPGKDDIELVSLLDMDILRNAVEEVKPALIVIDPIQAYLGPGVNMNRAEDVRQTLTPVAKLAEEFKFAVIIIRHLTKSGKDKASYRGMRVIYNGKAYQITWIDDFEGNKDNIKIYANIVK